MKNLFVSKRFSIIALFAVISVGFTYAESNTYYAKARARVGSTGEGKVYASANTTNNPDYTAAGNTAEKEQNNTDFTFYMYAKADDGYDFTGWSTSANGLPLSNSAVSPYSYSVSSNAESKNAATENNLYAIFRPLPTFYFSATAVVVPNGAGTASVSPAVTNVYGEHWNSTSATTNAITFTATSGANHVFQGWSKTESGEIESSANSYKPTITSNSTNSGSPSNTTFYARFLPYPTGVTASPVSMILGEGDSETINAVVTPSGSYSNIGFESSNTSVATVNANGVVTAVSGGEATITVKAFKSDGVTVIATVSVSVSVIEKCATPVITFEPSSDGKTATTTLSTTTENASIYYTIGGGEPSTSSTLYTGPFNVSNGQTVRAITVKPGCKESKVKTSTFVAEKVALPSIEIASTGVSFSCATPVVSFYYTINGDNPTTSLTPWNGAPLTGLSEGTNIKVIAAKSGMIPSDMATKLYFPTSNANGTTVILNDFEDHNWTYYSGVDRAVDGGNYNDNYVGKLYSPNPRNVKITYNGVNGISGSVTDVRVSISENENSFVYYKTLEQGSTQGEYPYTVISNPFSVRPSTGSNNSKVYYGFAGWKIKSGGEYIKGYNNNDVLPLDANIVFENLPYNSVNCISAEIVLETTWKQANRTYVSSNPNSNQTYSTNGDYESNFYVINCNYTRNITASSSVTIMMVEPDGSADYRNNNTFSGNITPDNDGVTKIEYAKWNPSGDINATGRNVTLGRGLTMGGTRRTIYGTNTNRNINQVFKIESGTYSTFYAIGSNGPSNNMTKQHIVFGNDYDRAKGENNNLILTNNFYLLGRNTTIGQNKLIITVKSGKITRDLDHDTAGASANCCYLWYNSGGGTGSRELIVEGGEMWHIAGGYDSGNDDSSTNLKIRVKGGTIHGSIYGGAAKYDTKGYKQFIFTGGIVEGWIAGGSNGYLAEGDDNMNGTVTGRSYVYVGGRTQVTSGNSTTAIDMSVGGNVYGAGCGNTEVNNSGSVTEQTNVVIADECYVQRGVYGGGAYGSSPGTANVYITGNAHVGGVYENTFDVYGGVYGGARAKGGGSTNIYMTGGYVEHGVYGGSNLTGTINNNVTMQINGGQVGTSSKSANIHGGGYGQATRVSGNVEVTLGTEGQATGGVTVYGDVYGGSALGTVNSDANDHTYVTMYKGTINGSLYGGGLGSASVAANVNGPVKVEVHGGSVKATSVAGSGGVYGANNINGAPQRSVTVDIYGTDPAPAEGEYALYAVYGGGNQADYLYGNAYPTVTVHGCDNSIEYVYGGGNAAAVKSTNVTIWGGNVIGNVFGGGHGYKDGAGADVEGNVNVAIKGGTIKKVFGGSNSKGNISGTINLEINKDGACDMRIGEVYGGGNEADGNAGAVTIGCTGALVEGDEGHAAHPENIGKILEGIGAVYGGANNANVTNASGITLNINSGMVANVFGGNNTGGGINGTITVNVNKNEETCGWYVGNVFGGGNLAQYSGAPAVNILNGEVSGNVYGGGKGDANDHSKGQVTGNPTVTIGDKSNAGYEAIVKGDVYGGGDAGNVVGTPVVNVVNKCNTNIGNVYGGGNAADVEGTDVNIDGGTITGMVFGGGHGDKNADPQTEANVNGNVNVDITGGTINKVFGGSNSKGNITGTIALNIEKGDESCELHITEVYGGGNEAAGNAGTITIGCTGSEEEGIGDVYGGANAADINSDITLNITGGKINRVFGGNNASGSINGGIVVNVNWNTENPCGVNYLGNVYGAGNLAQYGSASSNKGNYPAVNILNGTVSGHVFGGGLGESAIVYGNPQVTIGDNNASHTAIVTGDVYGGGDAANVVGTPVVKVVNDCNTQIGNVYGGGNAADVSATSVTIDGGKITGMVFGGGHGDKDAEPQTEANVNGDVNVLVTGGTINKVFGGSNSKGNIGGVINLIIEKGDESCELHIAEVYGGGNEAAGNAGTITIGCTGGDGEGIGDVYGGANAADINSDITLNITGGKINRVFGGNNASGLISGDIVVNVDWTGTCGVNKLTNVYGAGNQAAYGNAENQGSTQVNILNATVSGSVYGGGLGNSAVVTGTTEVNISEKDGGTVVVSQNVFGGGDAAAVTGSTDVNIIKGAVTGSVFGGGNAAGVSGVGVVDVTGGTIASGVYGGSNASGIVVNTQVTLTNGTIGTDAAHANVHGGGFGQETGVSGNVDILIGESNQTEGGVEIYGDVYGGSALGTVNGTSANDTYHTNVTLNKGTIYGSLYGGALGSDEVAANVYAPVTVTVNGGSVKKTAEEGSGGVYGANNINGAPQHSVIVNINATDPAPAEGQYALYAVYGGGNKAAYTYGKGYPKVTIYKCDNSIEYVYGGGNAAAVNGTNVTVWGGNTIGYVFGGGHGYKENSIGADVNGDVLVNIHGGTIDKVFGGSNSMGNITGNISLNITKEGECEMHIAEVYGGGNEAAGNAGTITIGCTGGDGEGIGDVYGGANAADINSGITLNITGGNISRVFGGNNANGSINGDIQVNVEWSGTCGVNALGNVYGAGNQAAYSGNTEVNILNGTVTGSVYGGGLGATAVVTGTTLVNINQESGGTVVVSQNVFGGGDAAAVTGSTDVNIIKGAVTGSVFGGGNAAGVSGVGVVDVTGGTIASGVYGGSNASGAVGNTTVTLANGTIGTDAAHANVHGGGYGKDTQVSGNVAVNIQGGTVYGDVYGGSALGTVNTNTSNTTAVNLTGGIIHGDAYGGGLGDIDTKADVNGNVTVTLKGTAFTLATTKDDEDNTIPTSGRVFGCNNINGSPKGTVLVQVLSTVAKNGDGTIKAKPAKDNGIYELQAVYGGGNLAAYYPTDLEADGQFSSYQLGEKTVHHENTDKPVQVVIDACDEASIEYVYGGGNAAPTPATDVLVLGSYEIGNVFGGGNGKDKYKLDGDWEENPGADVGIIDAVAYENNHENGLYGTGKSKASVLGGTVHNLFGASNTKGNVVKESLAYVDNAGTCPLNVGGIYGGGNEAYMDGDSKIELGCIEKLEEIYGGARNADVKGDVNLKIVSGHYDRVFGGNNLGGVIKGSITITVEETGCNPVTIGELYACGNLAPYTTPENKDHPTINLISFTSIGNVFGGGLGSKAVVTGNPVVNINVNNVGDNAERDWSYNGSTINFGNDYIVQLPVHEKGKIGVIGTVYGGGNEAEVVGNPQIEMTAGEVKRDIFGGGNKADVDGSTSVTIANGTIDGNIFGGGNMAHVKGSTIVTIKDGTIEGNVYGGGNEGNVTGATHVVIGPQPAQ